MREIKFRAWHKDVKSMFEVSALSKTAVGERKGGMCYTYDRRDVVLMQLTGLRDKNGVEIYEGDILGIEKGVIGKVEWNRDEAGYRLVVRSYQGCDDFKYFVNAGSGLRDMEVIGNVYEMDS